MFNAIVLFCPVVPFPIKTITLIKSSRFAFASKMMKLIRIHTTSSAVVVLKIAEKGVHFCVDVVWLFNQKLLIISHEELIREETISKQHWAKKKIKKLQVFQLGRTPVCVKRLLF